MRPKRYKSRAAKNSARASMQSSRISQRDRRDNVLMWHLWVRRDKLAKEAK